MSHAVSRATIIFKQVCCHQIEYEFGAEFVRPERLLPVTETPIPDREFRIQIASPPPDREDGKQWQTGLRVHGPDGGPDTDFKPNDQAWRELGVFYKGKEFSPLASPNSNHIVFDQTISVPAAAAGKVPPVFTLTDPDETGAPVGEVPHFISVPYVVEPVDGEELNTVGVAYAQAGTLRFTSPATSDWLALSTEGFAPGRASADYIIPVGPCPDDAGHP